MGFGARPTTGSVTVDELPASLGQSPNLLATAPRGCVVLRGVNVCTILDIQKKLKNGLFVIVRKNIFVWKICLRNSYRRRLGGSDG